MATTTKLGTQAQNKKITNRDASSNQHLQGQTSTGALGGVQGQYVSPINATTNGRSGSYTPYLTAQDYADMYGRDYSHTNTSPTTPTTPTTPTADGGGGGNGGGGGGGSPSGGNGSSPSTTGSAAPRSDIPFDTGYVPTNDPAYMEALNALTNLTGNAPTYTPSYDEQLADLYNRIIGRGPFQYDLNQDPFYQQYRTQAIDTGRLAMADSMGQAAALTGGYGSSYGAQVGQQQYDAYLRQLNEQVPEFYDSAYNRWLNEGNALEEQYALTRNAANDEYNRYQDSLSDYYTQLNNAANRENLLYNRGYQQNADANAARSDARDRLLQLMTTTGYQPSESELSAAGMSPDEAAAWRQYYIASITPASSGGSGGGSSGGRNSSVKLDNDQISGAMSAFRRGGEDGLAEYIGRLSLMSNADAEAYNPLWSYVMQYGALDEEPRQQTTTTGLTSRSSPDDVMRHLGIQKK